jgi:hypothetical protein
VSPNFFLLFFFNEIRNYDNNCFLKYILFKNLFIKKIKNIVEIKKQNTVDKKGQSLSFYEGIKNHNTPS